MSVLSESLSKVSAWLFNNLWSNGGEQMKDESYQKKPQKKSNIAPAEPAQEEDQIILLILRSEFNFLKYPFFDLSKTGERDSIEIRKEMKGEEGKAELLWKVTRNIDSSFPSAFDKKVHRAVEQIINQLNEGWS